MRTATDSILDQRFPADVELILSAMDAARFRGPDRRHLTRMPYRVVASLSLYSNPDGPPATLYTRDVDPRGLGFLSRERLPLGHGGMLRLPDPDGRELTIACSIYRCREAVAGWYEGALYFNRQQGRFGG